MNKQISIRKSIYGFAGAIVGIVVFHFSLFAADLIYSNFFPRTLGSDPSNLLMWFILLISGFLGGYVALILGEQLGYTALGIVIGALVLFTVLSQLRYSALGAFFVLLVFTGFALGYFFSKKARNLYTS